MVTSIFSDKNKIGANIWGGRGRFKYGEWCNFIHRPVSMITNTGHQHQNKQIVPRKLGYVNLFECDGGCVVDSHRQQQPQHHHDNQHLQHVRSEGFFRFPKAWRRTKLQRTAKHDSISSWLCLVTRAVNVDKAKRTNNMFAVFLRNSEQTLEHNKDTTKNIMQNLQQAQQIKQRINDCYSKRIKKNLANPTRFNRMAWAIIIRHEPLKRSNVNQCSYPE